MTILELLPQTERDTLKFRLLALLVVSVTVFFRVSDIRILPVVALISAYLAWSALLRLVLIPRLTSYGLLSGMLLVDSATLLAAIYFIGLNTPVVMLLPITVVYYGLYLGYAGGLLMATTSSIGFVAIAFALGRIVETASIIAIQVPSSFLLALLVGYLAQTRLRESEERRSQQQLIQAEAQGRRLLELAGTLEKGTWDDLAAPEMAVAASSIAGLPWAAVLLPNEERTALTMVGITYIPLHEIPVPLDGAPYLGPAWREDREVEHLGPLEERDLSWTPSNDRPEYLWAIPLGEALDGLLCVMGPRGSALDENRKQALRAFAPVAGRVLQARRLFVQVGRRSRDLVGELRSTVESTNRLSQTQLRRPLQFGRLLIEPARERVRLGSRIVHLSRTEFDLLYMLAANSGSVFNTETLLRSLWGPDYVPQGKPVDVAIHRLRRKLSAIPSGAGIIRTVRGRGYTFMPGEAAALIPDTTAANPPE